MRYLVTIVLFIMLSVFGYGQRKKGVVKRWKMYSEVCDSLGGPIRGGGVFDCRYYDSVVKGVDIVSIRRGLLVAFNKFRGDYGLSPVVEMDSLSMRCEEWSCHLVKDYGHYKITKGAECIGQFSVYSFCEYLGGDLNRVISESVFDLFVRSAPHMEILLNDFYCNWGFGVSYVGCNFYVVIRCQ